MVKTRRASAMEKEKNSTIKRVYGVKIHLKRDDINLYKTEFKKVANDETTTKTDHNLRTRRNGKYKF